MTRKTLQQLYLKLLGYFTSEANDTNHSLYHFIVRMESEGIISKEEMHLLSFHLGINKPSSEKHLEFIPYFDASSVFSFNMKGVHANNHIRAFLKKMIDITSDDILARVVSSKNVVDAKRLSRSSHYGTKHLYDGKPYYDAHIVPVVDYAIKYSWLLSSEEEMETAIASAYLHDIIEDCRVTYNDVATAINEKVADVAYALTNEKGKTRKDRANSKYYYGINSTPLATYVKFCDRLANIKYSFKTAGSMAYKYKREQENFIKELFRVDYNPMIQEMKDILSNIKEPIKP